MIPLTTNIPKRPRWGSYWVFLLAAIGSSVGLGNVWKFPYELGMHGGGNFLIVYIPCLFLVGFPLIMAELMIGRIGQSNPVQGIGNIVKRERFSSVWKIIGWLGMLTSFLIFSYYSVVASWILFYIMKSISGAFVSVPAEVVQHSFGALLRNTDQLIIWHTVFVLMVVLVLSQEVRNGLERAVRLLMPAFLGLLIWLCIYASQVGDFDAAYSFIFTYDLSAITIELVVSALTQALFSLSIGIGILIMYGSYLGETRPLFSGAASILVFDTAVALIMGLMIFSIVFAFGMRPDSGPGLIFETLPVAFAQMTESGALWSASFFLLLLVATLSSGFALLEPFIAWITECFNVSRRIAAWVAGGLAWLGGLASVYSFSDLKFSFYYFGREHHNGYFDLLNLFTTHLMMPFTALLIAAFAGWKLTRKDSRLSLNIRPYFAYKVWRLCIKIIAPLIISAVLLLVLFYPS